jgi:hypothetical protein
VVREIDAGGFKLGRRLAVRLRQLDPATGEILAQRGSRVSVENDEGEKEGGKGTSLSTRLQGGRQWRSGREL